MNWIQMRFLSHVCFVSHVIKTAKQMKGLSFHSAFLRRSLSKPHSLFISEERITLDPRLVSTSTFFSPLFFFLYCFGSNTYTQPTPDVKTNPPDIILSPATLTHQALPSKHCTVYRERTCWELWLIYISPSRWVQTCWCPPVKERKAHDGPPK